VSWKNAWQVLARGNTEAARAEDASVATARMVEKCIVLFFGTAGPRDDVNLIGDGVVTCSFDAIWK